MAPKPTALGHCLQEGEPRVSDDPMPRRVRKPARDAEQPPSSPRQGGPAPSDELMSQFDAIERMLQARRESQEAQEAQDAAERPFGDAVAATTDPVTIRPVTARPEMTKPAVADPGPSDAPTEAPPTRILGRRAVLLVSAAVVVALAAAATTYAAVHGTSGSNGTNGSNNSAAMLPTARSSSPLTPTSGEASAARWVAANVGAGEMIACDVNLCVLLRQAGMPASSLVTIGSDITQVERADVLISTPIVRQVFGTGLTAVSAPEPLASFGGGSDRIDVTAVALAGPGDYGRRLTADRATRRTVGAATAHAKHLTLTVPAITDLLGGLVDGRLCSLLTLLGSTHTLAVASFSGAGPGAGADIPDTDALITSVDGQPATGTRPQVSALLALVNAQQPPYRPMSVIHAADGIELVFSQPGPLGLIPGSTP